jgi:hypothetical protein
VLDKSYAPGINWTVERGGRYARAANERSVDRRVRREGSLIAVESSPHGPRASAPGCTTIAARLLSRFLTLVHATFDVVEPPVGIFSKSLTLAGPSYVSATDSFKVWDVKNLWAANAIKTVPSKTGTAATGYHIGGAVKVVIPKTDYMISALVTMIVW